MAKKRRKEGNAITDYNQLTVIGKCYPDDWRWYEDLDGFNKSRRSFRRLVRTGPRAKSERELNAESAQRFGLESVTKAERSIEQEWLATEESAIMAGYYRASFYRFVLGKNRVFEDYVGLSRHEFMRYIESLFSDGMSWDNYGDWAIDHIIPFSAYDPMYASDMTKAFNYRNLRPLWKSENSSKGNQIYKFLVQRYGIADLMP